MGYILSDDEQPDAFPYGVEVRRESFVLRGQQNWTWSRIDPDSESRVFWDDDQRPDGDGWECGYFFRTRGIYVYPGSADVNQGSVEMLIEDIPNIIAALHAVWNHVHSDPHN